DGHGHRVVGAVTDPLVVADRAVQLQPDVCIMDLGFPGGSGIEAVRQVAQRVPSTRVLVLSASTDPSAIRESFEAGALGFVRKQDSIAGVLDAIEHLMNGEIALDPRLLRAAMTQPLVPRGRDAPGTSYKLTPRETEVLKLIVEGRGTSDIADELHIAKSTARSHIQSVLVKTGVHNRLQVATLAVRLGLVAT
ncbi:MAG TPA: response regulator transcription factor, partial [Nakamurella sp.]